jgi:hypothetical protein
VRARDYLDYYMVRKKINFKIWIYNFYILFYIFLKNLHLVFWRFLGLWTGKRFACKRLGTCELTQSLYWLCPLGDPINR